MRYWRWLSWFCVGVLIVTGLGSWVSKGLAQNSAIPLPLVIYQPVQRLEWEGLQTTRQGIAYFAPNPIHDYLFSSSGEAALQYARESRDRRGEAEALLELGLARHLGDGFYYEAERYYQEGLDIAQELSDVTLELMFLGNLSVLYLQNSYYYIQPIDYLNQFYAYAWHGAYYYRGTDPRWAELALGNLGNLYLGADYYGQAIETHQQRLALAQDLSDRAGEAKALGDLGLVYQGLGDYAQAIDYHEQRLTIAQQIQDDQQIGQALSNLGIAYHSLGNYEQAREYQQRFLQLARDRQQLFWQEQALANLAGAYLFLGDLEQAEALYLEAIAISNQLSEHQLINTIRNNLGLVYQQQGRLDDSLSLYHQALAAAHYRNNPQGQAIALNNLGAGHLTQGDIEGAISAYYESVNQLESARDRTGGNDANQVALFETQRFPYENLQTLLLAEGEPEAALEIAERGRAQAFVDLLSQRLEQDNPRATARTPKIEEMVAIAQDRQATLVEYSLLSAPEGQGTRPDRLAIWVIAPDGTVTVRQVPLSPTLGNSSLEELVRTTRANLGVRGLGIAAVPPERSRAVNPFPNPWRTLSDLLINPIADLLPDDPQQPVIVVPQRELFLVPFAALPISGNQHLIDQHTLMVVPSLQVLGLTAQLEDDGAIDATAALVVGNPQMPSVATQFGAVPQPLPALPGSEAEAIAIGSKLGVQPLLGEQATETEVKARLRSTQLVHLATHGLLDEAEGLDSSVALAPSAEDDGLLTARELLTLALPADLVVLSACDTGRGRITGDGVIGLSRSLLAAGASQLVVSLWQVPDQATAELMVAFYGALQAGQDTAHALRTAMLETREQYPQVMSWAGFVVIGDGG